MANQTLFKYKTGSVFAAPLKYGGWLVIAIGLVIGTSATPLAIALAILFLLVGGVFATASTGIILNTKNKTIKHYTSILGLKRGNERPLDDAPFICIIQKNKGSGSNQRTIFEVYLLSKSHRGKMLVHISSSQNSAKAAMQNIAKALNVEIVEYSPPMAVKNGQRVKTSSGKL